MDLFDKIISKEIDAEIIFEDEDNIAFMDINPINPGHFLVVPKKHSDNFMDIDDQDLAISIVTANKLAKIMIEDLKVSGYKIQINNGIESEQEIMHTHIHVIPSIK